MRKAQSFACPFCQVTSEKRATAQTHMEKHVPLLNRRIAKKRATKRAASAFVSELGRHVKKNLK